MALPEKCDICGGTLANPCKHILGNPHRLVKLLRESIIRIELLEEEYKAMYQGLCEDAE